MSPRRLGAWRWEAVPRLRPVNTERAEARRHREFQELACTHLCNIPPDFIVLDKARRCTKREGRACRVRLRNADAAHAQVWQRPMWLRRPEYRATPQSVFAKVQGGNRRTRLFGQYDNPIIFHTLQWVKQRASQPQNQSPCPRASARPVLTGRRPRDVPAPPRRVARKGGTSRNREAVPPWMGSSDHTTSLAPSRFTATRRGGAGTSRTYTTQPPFPHRFFQSTAASRAMSRR